MMITLDSPTLAIRPFWLSYPKEEINENAEIFGCLPGLDLPTHFNFTSYMDSYQKEGQVVPVDGMGQFCT